MFNLRRWFGFFPLISLVALFVSAVSTGLPKFEANLTQLAAKALAPAQLPWAQAKAKGQDLLLTGAAPTLEMMDTAKSLLAGVPGVRNVINNTTLQPAETPYVFSLKRADTKIIAEGALPSTVIKGQIFEHIRATISGAEIEDKTRFANGAGEPNNWYKGVHFSVAQLGRISNGQVKLTDGLFDIAGSVETNETYDTIKTALQALPEGLKLNGNSLALAKPKSYDLTFERMNSSLKIVGFVPSEKFGAELLEKVQNVMSDVKVTTDVRVAQNAPASFLRSTQSAILNLSRVQNGTVKIVNDTMDIAALVEGQEQFDDIQASLRGLKGDVAVTATGVALKVEALKPFVLKLANGIIATSGELPDQTAKDMLTKQAQAAGLTLQDTTTVVKSQPKLNYGAALAHTTQALRWAKSLDVTIDKETVNLKGEAIDATAYDVAMQYFAALPAGKISAVSFKAPLVQPFKWTLQKDGNAVEMTGYVQNKDVRAKLLGRARSTYGQTASLIDTMHFASSMENEGQWVIATQYAIEISKLLKRATISLEGLNISITGQANTADDYTTVKGLVKLLPAGLIGKTIAIEPPASASFFWKLEKTNDAIVMSGSVRHEHDASVLSSALASRGYTLPINGQWGIEGGAPQHFQELATVAINALSTFATGSVEIRGQSIAVNGVARTALGHAKLHKQFTALTNSSSSKNSAISMKFAVAQPANIAQLSAEQCQAQLQSAVPASAIFATLDTQFSVQFAAKIPQLAEILAQCPQTQFKVSATKDTTGGGEFQTDLASRRARTIAKALVNEGIVPERLKTQALDVQLQADANTLRFVPISAL